MKSIWKRLLPLGALCAMSAAIGVTGATILHTMKLENPIKTPPVTGEIVEDLEGNAKKVGFKNNGEADVFLRVAYTENWTNGDLILPNKAPKKDGSDHVLMAAPKWKPDGWELGDDGWLYYKKVLPVGSTTPNIVEVVTFADAAALADLSEADAQLYKNGTYDLHFTMEVVQASEDKSVSEDAVKQLFGKDLPQDWTMDEINWPAAEKWSPE